MGTTKPSPRITPWPTRSLTNITFIQTASNLRTCLFTMTSTVTSIRRLLGLLHLASPALPIGGFSYSQGLEGAIDAGLVYDADTTQTWIQSGLEHVLATNELPMLAMLHRQWEDGNCTAISRSNTWFLASRESFELRQETEQMGWSLAQLALSLQWNRLQEALRSIKPIVLPTAFAYAATALGIERRPCLEAYLFAWVENQVAAAIKAVPLG